MTQARQRGRGRDEALLDRLAWVRDLFPPPETTPPVSSRTPG